MRQGDELIVNAGSFKRSIILPRILHGLNTLGAKFDGNKLRIAFGEASQEEDAS
jgi:arsenite-transporting ATPase